jgi:MSHA biogenesis protein MshO
MRCPSPRRARGVTLIELVIVISITAIIAGAVAVFISRPIEGYADATRRADLTDAADTALRRMTSDLRTALPNSIRVVEQPPASGIWYLEYLQTSGGGRYRAEAASDGTGNILDFSNPAGDSSFDVLGPLPTLAAGDQIVVYNLNSSGGTANAYSGDNRAAYQGAAGSTITLTAPKVFPFTSPGRRFQVVQHAVTYECNPSTGVLRRYWNYGIAAAQATPPVTPNNALLATSVIACGFTYDNVSARTGLVTLSVRVGASGELVRLFQQVHVNNVP